MKQRWGRPNQNPLNQDENLIQGNISLFLPKLSLTNKEREREFQKERVVKGKPRLAQ
jgi:hypothetical protein